MVFSGTFYDLKCEAVNIKKNQNPLFLEDDMDRLKSVDSSDVLVTGQSNSNITNTNRIQ